MTGRAGKGALDSFCALSSLSHENSPLLPSLMSQGEAITRIASGIIRDLSLYIVIAVLLGTLQEECPWLIPAPLRV